MLSLYNYKSSTMPGSNYKNIIKSRLYLNENEFNEKYSKVKLDTNQLISKS